MNRPHRLQAPAALALLLAAALPAQAEIFKIVGPDGRVTYSDRRPADPQAQTSTFGRPAPAASVAPAPAAPAPAATPHALGKGAKQAIAGAPTAAAVAPPPAPGPALPARELTEAVLGVLGYVALVQQSTDLCLGVLPTSFARYDGAASSWRQRNAALTGQTDRVLAEAYTPDQRSALQADAKSRTQDLLAPVAKAPKASQIKWCDHSADEMRSTVMDLAPKPKLAGPIQAWHRP